MVTYNLVLTFLIAALWRVSGVPQTPSAATHLNTTSSSSINGEHELTHNVTDATVGSRLSPLMAHLPTLKNIVIFICVLTAALITCLVIKVIRRIRKTRKYDIITTPAERVEMAPLNEENDDDDDSTLFDVKYRVHLDQVAEDASVVVVVGDLLF
ncbi:Membrane protein FAM174B [Collichthys lucidus]|uniref:Membrane protein FAM174B n=1 Tax=Collichthys lucidus TaxID=240159 RepID=A0A4U5UH48_COLLU|nr:Membrane protein FAM174B [Collichthys lucidus]